MADNIRATPQNATLGAIANFLKQTYAPQRTQQMQGVMELLGVPALARTTERMSYGEPITNINKANVPLLPADTAEAAMLAGPPLASLAKRVGTNLVQTAPYVARDLAQSMTSPMRSYVVKPKGGNWLAGSVERAVEPMKRAALGMPPPEDLAGIANDPRVLAELDRRSGDAAMNRWLESKLGKYIKNEMGTPEDPVRALAERGVLHVDPEQLNFRPELHGRFMSEGQTAVAQSPAAKSWEGASDLTVGQMPAGQLLQQGYAEQMPWLAKVPPETPVYMPSQSGMADDLGFGHLVDELRNAVNPESGLPANLRLKYQDLEKVTVPQAVERVAKINEWRAAQKAEADMARAMNPAAQVVKEYPEQGFKWVELRQPEVKELPEGYSVKPMERDGKTYYAVWEPPSEGRPQGRSTGAVGKSPEEAIANQEFGRISLEDALKYEGETMGHCVGGYCPDVVEGRSKIYSLRDKKGQPHVTIEVRPGKDKAGLLTAEELPPEELADMKRRNVYDPNFMYRYNEQMGRHLPELGPFDDEIVQIKGKANRAPNAEYLPAVQDFVRSGNWSKVGDLQNTGLISYKGEYRLPEEFLYRTDEGGWEPLVDVAKRAFPDSPAKQLNFFRGASELENDIKLKPQGEGFAEGGLVGGANSPTLDFDPARIDAIVDELHALNAG